MTGSDPMEDEFDTMAAWTADAVEELGADTAIPAACRGSGSPEGLRWLARGLGLQRGLRLLDSGAGVGGPAELAAREFGVTPTLTDPMEGACRAAARLFGRPVVVAGGEALPFADAAFDAAWSLGVLCTVEDKPSLLAELRRVVRPSGTVALLVYERQLTPLPQQPDGNHFPSRDDTDRLLGDAGLVLLDHTPAGDFPDAPDSWSAAAERVDAVIARDHGDDRRFGTAREQEDSIGRLIGDGSVVGRLLLARVPG